MPLEFKEEDFEAPLTFTDADFEPTKESTSSLGAFARSGLQEVGPGAAFATAFGPAMEAATVLASGTGPWAPVIGIGSGIVAGTGAAWAAKKAQNAALDVLAPETAAELERLNALDREQHGLASALGRLAAPAASFKLAPGAVVEGVRALPNVVRGVATEAEKQATIAAGSQLGVGTGLGVLTPVVTEGRLPTVEEVGEAAAMAGLYGAARWNATPRSISGRFNEVISQKPKQFTEEDFANDAEPKPTVPTGEPTPEAVVLKPVDSPEVVTPVAETSNVDTPPVVTPADTAPQPSSSKELWQMTRKEFEPISQKLVWIPDKQIGGRIEPAHYERVGKTDPREDFKVGDVGQFYRAGTLPKSGFSRDYRDNRTLAGVSVYPTPVAGSFAGLKDADWFTGRGKVVGTGPDGEPLIKPIGKWKKFSKAKSTDIVGDAHKFHVKEAIREGKIVPSEVLAEYPDLHSPAPEVAVQPAEVQESAPVSPEPKAATVEEVAPVESAPTPDAQPTAVPPPEVPPKIQASIVPGDAEFPIGLNNAQTEKLRAEFGMAEREAPLTMSNQSQLEHAAQVELTLPNIGMVIAKDVGGSPRAVEPWEYFAMERRLVKERLAHSRAAEEMNKAFEAGDLEARNRWEEERKQAFENIQMLRHAGEVSGTPSGRSMQARRRLLDEDMSLAGMELQKRADLGGRPLTPDEMTQIEELHQRLSKAELARDEAERKLAQKLYDEQYDQLMADPEVKASAQVISLADRIVKSLKVKADEARARQRGKLRSGLSPEDLKDSIVIMVSNMAEDGLDFARASARIIGELGDWIKPHVKEIYDKAVAALNGEVTKVSKNPRVKARITKDDATKSAESIGRLKANLDPNDPSDIFKLAREIQRSLAIAGETDRTRMLDAVHNELKTILPGITKEDVQRTLSGYGRFTPATSDSIKLKITEWNRELLQLSKIQSIKDGQIVLKTGKQRPPASDAERRLIREYNELKKTQPDLHTDPAVRLKTALETTKTRLENQIKDLQRQIESKTKDIPTKTTPPTSPEIEALRSQRDVLKAQFDEIFGKEGLTDQQRLRNALTSVEKSVAELERRIGTGDLSPEKAPSKTPENPDLIAARAKRDFLKAEIERLKEAQKPQKTPEQAFLERLLKRAETNKKKWEARLRDKDFAVKNRPERPTDPALMKADLETHQAKMAWEKARLEDKRSRMTAKEKAVDIAREVVRLQRDWFTGFDASATLKQGGMFAFSHPLRAAGILVKSIRSMLNPEVAHAITLGIRERENFKNGLYKRAGLEITDPNGTPSEMEEAIMSRIANLIPEWAQKFSPIEAGRRAFMTTTNLARAELFDLMHKNIGWTEEFLQKLGLPAGSAERSMKGIANYANVITGRGKIGFGERSMDPGWLNDILFAARWAASRFNIIAGQPFYKGTTASRAVIAKEYGQAMISIMAMYKLAQAMGFEVGTDSTSSNFGKIHIPGTHTWFDPLFGLLQPMVLASRMIQGKSTTGTGKVTYLRGPYHKSVDKTPWGVATDFVRTKLGPLPGAVVDMINGEDLNRQKLDWKSADSWKYEIAKYSSPMTAKDMYEVMQDLGASKGLIADALIFLGVGANVRDKDKSFVK